MINKKLTRIKYQKPLDSILLLTILLFMFLSSCSIIDGAFGLVKDNVNITWKNDNNEKLQIVDSILIVSKPVYFQFDRFDLYDGEDTTFTKNNYNVWLLRTGNNIRIEVNKNDTLIYLYKQIK